MPSLNVNRNRPHEPTYLAKLGFSYNRKRERFFDLCDKITKSFTVILGASLLATYVKEYAPLIGASVSAVGLLALVFGYSDRKQKHKELAENYADLLSKMEQFGEAFGENELNQWHSELQKLNAKEPPTLGTLVVICQNEIAVSEGDNDSVIKINGWKQFFANWWDFNIPT